MMRIDEIQSQVASQHAAMRAFPSQGPTIEQMYAGQNQVALLEVQIESNKSLREQRQRIAELTEAVTSLVSQVSLHQTELRERDHLEARRYAETMRLTKIAAWSGVVGVLLAGIAIVAQIMIR